MKVLITGANGFAGHYLTELLLQKKYTVIATGKGSCRLPFQGHSGFVYEEMDFTNAAKTTTVINAHQPDVVVHAGAMSKPNDCEADQEAAYMVNVTGTENLLHASAAWKCLFIFLSTDFIFDGEKGLYCEEDEPAPVNYYGKTKLLAEGLVKKYPFNWAIVRTVLVYGPPIPGRPNLLSIVKEKLEKEEMYSVVDDQFRTPTFVNDLAKSILAVIEKNATGVFHISGDDMFTPFQMACMSAAYLGLDVSLIRRVTAEIFKEPARRPPRTGFNIDKAKAELGYVPVSFETGLQQTFTAQK